MNRVLITGGAGFIGSHLIASQLGQGYEVVATDLQRPEAFGHIDHPCLEWISGDLRDQDLVRRLVQDVDLIYHLASAHLDTSLPDETYWQVNVIATQALLEAAREEGIQRFVLTSSVGVYGDILTPPVDEGSPTSPTNIYARTKLAGEQAALEFARSEGLPLVVVRPAWVYGPRCPRTRKLLLTIRKGRFVMVGDGSTLRHPLYVADAVAGLELCAQHPNAAGEIYILAGEQPVTIQELMDAIAGLYGVRAPLLRVPIWLARSAAYLLQTISKPLGKRPPVSLRSLDFFIKHNAYDIRKAKDELGFQPQWDLQAGLQKTIRWINNQNEDSP